jgi:hypothetical protein
MVFKVASLKMAFLTTMQEEDTVFNKIGSVGLIIRVGLVIIMIAGIGLSLVNVFSYNIEAQSQTGIKKYVNGEILCIGSEENCSSLTGSEIT